MQYTIVASAATYWCVKFLANTQPTSEENSHHNYEHASLVYLLVKYMHVYFKMIWTRKKVLTDNIMIKLVHPRVDKQ